MDTLIRVAASSDLPGIRQLIEPRVAQRVLLPRSDQELQQLLGDSFVAEQKGRIVAFAAVEIYSKKLAEILCLSVADQCQGQGIGRRLVGHCVERARRCGVLEVMAITTCDAFFHRCGFDFALPDQKKALFFQIGQHRAGER